MHVKTDIKYSSYKTARQWAKNGFLPKKDAAGIKLWANQYCQDCFEYFSPDDVIEATSEDIALFFKPERDRRNEKARQRRMLRAVEKEKQRQREKQNEITRIVEPYIKKINELHKIIGDLSKANSKQTENNEKCFVIHTKTTGVDPNSNELLQISIIDFSGETVFDSYIKPYAKSWKKAEQINGISPEMVKDSPTVIDVIADINLILAQADTIIGYNTFFDISFLQNNGVFLSCNVKIIDVMKIFAPIYGEWSDYHEDFKYQKLTRCAAYYGYDWGKDTEHNSLSDCRATLYCYRKMKQAEGNQ